MALLEGESGELSAVGSAGSLCGFRGLGGGLGCGARGGEGVDGAGAIPLLGVCGGDAGRQGLSGSHGGGVCVDVERAGNAVALPRKVGDDLTGAHGVDPEVVRLADDEVDVAHGRGGGDRVADGVVEILLSELGLGEQGRDLVVEVETDADI